MDLPSVSPGGIRARQQLENPTYYAYWRNSRALEAGVLPGTLDAVDLYDLKGRNLSVASQGEAHMPTHIDAQNMRPFLMHEYGHDHLLYFFPFYQDAATPSCWVTPASSSIS